MSGERSYTTPPFVKRGIEPRERCRSMRKRYMYMMAVGYIKRMKKEKLAKQVN